MVQMDLIEWMDARAGASFSDGPGRPMARVARRGVSDPATGRLYAVVTSLEGMPDGCLRTRILEDHEAILTDASRFGG
jgi:hypothetical protein